MSSRKLLAGLLVISVLLMGCGAMSKLQNGQTAFTRGEVAKAAGIIRPLEEKTGDKDYPLVLLSLGSVEMTYGDYVHSSFCFQAAIANLEVEISGAQTAVQILRSEESRLYRGFPHEKVLAHMYLGFAYMQRRQLNEARIEFAKASEEDKGKEAGQEDDFLPVHFLDGLRAIREGDYEHARVSFRKVVEIQPELALGWYSLARASDLDYDRAGGDEAWERYEALVDPSGRLARNGSTPCAIFLVDAGWGPYRTKDPLIGEFALWNNRKCAESNITVACADNEPVSCGLAGDTYFQASTTGGFGEDVAKKVVSVAAKKAITAVVPLAGLFLKSEADTRAWEISPGKVYFGVVPVPKTPSTVEIDAYDKRGKHLPIKQQVLYYIAGRPFDEAQIIYARILPNADYRESY